MPVNETEKKWETFLFSTPLLLHAFYNVCVRLLQSFAQLLPPSPVSQFHLKKNVILPRSVHGVPHIITTIIISSLLAFCTFFSDLFFFFLPIHILGFFFSSFNTRSQPVFLCLSSCYVCYPFFFPLFHLLLRVRQFTCAFTFLTGAVVAHRFLSDYSASHSTFELGKYIVHLTITIAKKETDAFTRFGGRQAQGKRTSERFGSNKKALWRRLFRKPGSFFFFYSLCFWCVGIYCVVLLFLYSFPNRRGLETNKRQSAEFFFFSSFPPNAFSSSAIPFPPSFSG